MDSSRNYGMNNEDLTQTSFLFVKKNTLYFAILKTDEKCETVYYLANLSFRFANLGTKNIVRKAI